jgi:hypothetical protein
MYYVLGVTISLDVMNEAIKFITERNKLADVDRCSKGKPAVVYGIPNVGKLHESVVQHLIRDNSNCDARIFNLQNGKKFIGLIVDFMKCYSNTAEQFKMFIIGWAGNGRFVLRSHN